MESRKKALSTGKITRAFVPQIPDAVWSLEREALLSPSNSEASDYARESDSESSSGSEEEDQQEEKKTTELQDALAAAKERAKERAKDPELEDEEDDEESDAESVESTTHRDRRKLVEIHAALFSLQDNYRFVKQVTSTSPSCYVVEDPEHGRAVLKICPLVTPADRPPKEIRCMMRCQCVPGVLRLLRWHSLPDAYYAFLSPVVKDHCISHMFKDAAKVRSYMRQALTMLSGCLKQGVVHRDVKVGNFFWDDDTGVLTLADFDCSTVDPERVRHHSYGTRSFMSPEMRAGTGYTWKTDVYSLGVVFAMLLYREDDETALDEALVAAWATDPKAGNKKKQRKSKAKAERAGEFYGTPAARRLMLRMLAKNPADRPTYDEALSDPYFEEK